MAKRKMTAVRLEVKSDQDDDGAEFIRLLAEAKRIGDSLDPDSEEDDENPAENAISDNLMQMYKRVIRRPMRSDDLNLRAALFVYFSEDSLDEPLVQAVIEPLVRATRFEAPLVELGMLAPLAPSVNVSWATGSQRQP